MRPIALLATFLAASAACFPPTAPTQQGRGSGGGFGSPGTLIFTVQPTNANEGNIITPAVQVTAQDTLGVRDTSFTANVSVALGSNPVAGTLGGTRTVAAVAGVASFGDLTIDRAGSGYTLTASAPGATSTTSAAFSVTERPPPLP